MDQLPWLLPKMSMLDLLYVVVVVVVVVAVSAATLLVLTAFRFTLQSYGWHTLVVADGDNDLAAILAAIEEAKTVTDKPTIIKVLTHSHTHECRSNIKPTTHYHLLGYR
jgi:transketolase